MQAVKRHYEDAVPIMDLVREMGIQYRMIKGWLSAYNKNGYNGLTARKRGRQKRTEPKSDAERIRQLEMENEVLCSFLEEFERGDVKK